VGDGEGMGEDNEGERYPPHFRSPSNCSATVATMLVELTDAAEDTIRYEMLF